MRQVDARSRESSPDRVKQRRCRRPPRRRLVSQLEDAGAQALPDDLVVVPRSKRISGPLP